LSPERALAVPCREKKPLTAKIAKEIREGREESLKAQRSQRKIREGREAGQKRSVTRKTQKVFFADFAAVLRDLRG
jgi:hypothetical protein